jgi:flagellar hook assembly protein FlgD
VYNLLGEKIRTLVDTPQTAGVKQITWDGTNDAGARVATGMYLYRIEAGAFAATRKLAIIR